MVYNSGLIKELISIDEFADFGFDNFGLSNSNLPNTISFLDTADYVEAVNTNNNIVALFTTQELNSRVSDRIIKLISTDPRYDFYKIYNQIKKREYERSENIVSNKAIIDTSVIISQHNVVIEENVLIYPGAIILPDVIIRKNCIIGPGTVIGTEGFEVKRTAKGLLPVFHDGSVILNEGVEIGANCTVAKGIMSNSTVIGSGTKIDNLVHVAHNVRIGSNCLIIASSCILGSVTIGNDVWIGPSTVIRNGVDIGDRSEITMGSIISQNVRADMKIVGRLAMDKMMTF